MVRLTWNSAVPEILGGHRYKQNFKFLVHREVCLLRASKSPSSLGSSTALCTLKQKKGFRIRVFFFQKKMKRGSGLGPGALASAVIYRHKIRIWDPPRKIRTAHWIFMKIGMFVPVLRASANTKFELSTLSGTCSNNASKIANLLCIYICTVRKSPLFPVFL